MEKPPSQKHAKEFQAEAIEPVLEQGFSHSSALQRLSNSAKTLGIRVSKVRHRQWMDADCF